ncbi:hypothetical protein [Chondrinema litorale]|uniref:hypothetical protein n=1 Tax=Chondrinema litorale TaxID=2994555 RepID=UPI002542F607|nr:hypothetical protein [Chondrinema litorale]UZR99623.1 hypothetical protein OQ292_37170 [Chondrinema litorale]
MEKKPNRKRKIIDLDFETFEALQEEATNLHYNLKRYIEYILIKKAEELKQDNKETAQ